MHPGESSTIVVTVTRQKTDRFQSPYVPLKPTTQLPDPLPVSEDPLYENGFPLQLTLVLYI